MNNTISCICNPCSVRRPHVAFNVRQVFSSDHDVASEAKVSVSSFIKLAPPPKDFRLLAARHFPRRRWSAAAAAAAAR